MSRADAISRAGQHLHSGGFLTELDRRVAWPTESQNPARSGVLRGYLEQELLPAFSELGFSGRLIESPVWMWHWAKPADRRVPWSRMRALQIAPEVLAKKRMALAAHVTQLVPRDTGDGPVLGDGVLERLDRDHEYFIV